MFIGREHELNLLKTHLADHSKAQLIILYGRRRIGKSTLIKKVIQQEKNTLCFEGIQGAATAAQIDQFLADLSKQTGRVKLAAKNWREVFQGLDEIIHTGRWVLVFDEFPWMAAGQSDIISDLKLYWDRWARNQDLALFLCGSVASFMTKHLVHSKALHNRKTLEIHLGPLTPSQTGQFIKTRSLWEKAQLYMCLGGVPKYLEQINPKISLEKNLNRLCFSANGFFVNELETLFKEQFRAIKTYERITRELSRAPLSLSELAKKTGIAKGGGLHEHLQNLIRASFVREYTPFVTLHQRRVRTKIYKLVDPFLILYFRYIEPHLTLISKNTSENLFRAIVQPSLHQYYGFAFERLCEDAFDAIRKKLEIDLADILNMGPYFQQKREDQGGLQIDQLIMRRDHVWTLLEYKYHNKPIGLGIVAEIAKKIERFPHAPHITLEKVLIAANGATEPVKRSGFFNAILTLPDLVLA